MTEVRLAGKGGAICDVKPGSLAETAGILPADRLLAINGWQLRDVIDYQFYSTEERLTLEVERDGAVRKVEIDNDTGEPLGLEFEDPTFDRLRACNNNCPFRFLKGLPRGMRRTLYLKDDDYRYSFLLPRPDSRLTLRSYSAPARTTARSSRRGDALPVPMRLTTAPLRLHPR